MRQRRLVLAVVFPQVQMLDVAGPLQVFATANEHARPAAPPYEIVVASSGGGVIRTSSGVGLDSGPLPGGRPIDTLIVAGGPGVESAAQDALLMDWLRAAAGRARRVCSVCTGAFLLAEAGLLTGRRVATHWVACRSLQEGYPNLQVQPDPIYVQDGKFWTSAGITTGIDLALALVEDDLGQAAAMQTARHLVVFMKRSGGQSQFSAPLAAQAADGFADLHAWMAGNVAGDLRVERLAARAGMSGRSFARRYAERTGTTPAKAVELLRVEAARRHLEESSDSLKRIARACGFQGTERLRRAFLRSVGVAPGAYRARFGAQPERSVRTAASRSKR